MHILLGQRSRIKAIFLSHIHGDHTIGLAGLLRTLALNKRTEPLYIYIPAGYQSQLQALMAFDNAAMGYKIIVSPITRSGVVYKEKGFEVSAFRLSHNVPTYGFTFKENDGTRFLKQKIKGLGIKGTMFQSLLKNKSIKIGKKTIRLNDVTFKKNGLKVVYATDTRPAQSTQLAARNADMLIHESTYSDSEKGLAKQRLHSTASEAASIAKRAKAKRLVLVHISARYRSTDQLAKEARKIFKNTEVAKDGLAITL